MNVNTAKSKAGRCVFMNNVGGLDMIVSIENGQKLAIFIIYNRIIPTAAAVLRREFQL